MTLGANVDGSVRRIDTAYEVRGMVDLVTSYASTGGTTMVNQVTLGYNAYEQLIFDQQDHRPSSGPNLTVSLRLPRHGTSNTVRRTAITYPYSSLPADYIYDSGDDNALSRVSSLSFTGATVAAWKYFGLSSVAETEYDIAGTQFHAGQRLQLSGPRSLRPDRQSAVDARDDRRPGPAQLRLRSGEQPHLPARCEGRHEFDELYSYDGMHRLTAAARGTFSSGAPPRSPIRPSSKAGNSTPPAIGSASTISISSPRRTAGAAARATRPTKSPASPPRSARLGKRRPTTATAT